ncbi:MAG: hypothetical protein Q9170_002968 [Blastenia crenularia]
MKYLPLLIASLSSLISITVSIPPNSSTLILPTDSLDVSLRCKVDLTWPRTPCHSLIPSHDLEIWLRKYDTPLTWHFTRTVLLNLSDIEKQVLESGDADGNLDGNFFFKGMVRVYFFAEHLRGSRRITRKEAAGVLNMVEQLTANFGPTGIEPSLVKTLEGKSVVEFRLKLDWKFLGENRLTHQVSRWK